MLLVSTVGIVGEVKVYQPLGVFVVLDILVELVHLGCRQRPCLIIIDLHDAELQLLELTDSWQFMVSWTLTRLILAHGAGENRLLLHLVYFFLDLHLRGQLALMILISHF